MQQRSSAEFSRKHEFILNSIGTACATILFAGLLACDAYGADKAAGSSNAGAPAEQMTLDRVVADVLEHNPELNFYSAEIAAAKGEARTAATWANPELSATVGDKRVTSGGLATEGVAWSVSVRQTFEWPGRIPLRKAIANQQIQLAELGLCAVQSRAGRADALSRLRVVRRAAESRGGPEVADRFHALRQVLVQRDPAGITPELELRIIEATEITLLRKASEASVAEQAALLELNQLRGQPWQRALTVATGGSSVYRGAGAGRFVGGGTGQQF